MKNRPPGQYEAYNTLNHINLDSVNGAWGLVAELLPVELEGLQVSFAIILDLQERGLSIVAVLQLGQTGVC